MTMFGTQGSFEHNAAGAVWLTKDRSERESLDAQLTCRVAVRRVEGDMDKVIADDGTHHTVAPVHPVHRLPDAFRGLPNGS